MLSLAGEGGDADEAAIENEVPQFRARLACFLVPDIFNAGEYGVFYRLSPTRTIAPGQLNRRKKQKQRFTVLGCCNADSTERVPPLVIEHSANSRCFRGRCVDESRFEYRSMPKAWMSQELFFDWLHRFEAYIARTAGRLVGLLVNSSSRGTYDTLPNLLHFEVLFLQKNSTSRTQALKAGIIACIKRRFRHRQLEREFDLMEDGITQNLYSIDLYMAINNVSEIWTRLETGIIQNCWMKKGLLSPSPTLTHN